MGGSGRDFKLKCYSLHFPGGSKKKHEKPVRTTSLLA
jgi:hypothetical protein